jgi:DNA-directed RNA polymerase specialized sigma24 family protein
MQSRSRSNPMRINEWLTPSNPCRQFNDNEQLFQALKSLNNSAILCIQTKAIPSAHKLVQQYGLPPEKVDELVNESTLIFLRKISDGSYQFQGHAPSSYLVEIMKRVALMMTRKKQHSYELIEDHQNLQDPDLESTKRQQESAELVRQFLGQMGEPCASVIRLHHIDGYSDDEVVRQGWTRYSTTDSLKIKRSDCMKKLIQIAQQWRISNHT